MSFTEAPAANTYGPKWPEWAYQVARDALLYGKRVSVLAYGEEPYGDRIVFIILHSS
ncbi:MAG: hypothetical protein ACM3ML_38370 [Micromonosporaceae bacterium]